MLSSNIVDDQRGGTTSSSSRSLERQKYQHQHPQHNTAVRRHHEEHIKVFLRLRPVNRQEKSKRSKDCIELHDHRPGWITVDSPLQGGTFEFQFNGVFDEFASNEEVYRGCCYYGSGGGTGSGDTSDSSIPQKILNGTDCTLFSYGQSKTGKSHSIFGEGGHGIEMGILATSTNTIGGSGVGGSRSSTIDDSRITTDQSFDGGSITDDNETSLTPPRPTPLDAQLERELDPHMNPQLTMGTLPRLVSDLFEVLYSTTEQDSTYEFTIRCSFVEIYIEQMTDLIQPGHEEARGLRVGTNEDGTSDIIGATELCCVSPQDVFALISRGMANRRTKHDATTATTAVSTATTNQYYSCDPIRSHTVFTLRLSQIDRVSGRQCHSRLQVLDLAASEEMDSATTTTTNGTTTSTKDKATSSVSTEDRMINASFSKLHAMVKDVLQKQQNDGEATSVSQNTDHKLANGTDMALNSQLGSRSKLTKLLQSAIGGNSYTVMLCTASSSYHNIDATVRTLRFGRQVLKVTNTLYDSPSYTFSLPSYRLQLRAAKQRENQLLKLIRLMAQESKHGKSKKKDPKNPKVWDAIVRIADIDRDLSKGQKSKKDEVKTAADKLMDGFRIAFDDESEPNSDMQQLQTKVTELQNSLQVERTNREKSESLLTDIRTELITLKNQNAELMKQNQSLSAELTATKSDMKTIQSQKMETEHRLRTSLFRENEAILFMRQLRTFYFRLLKNKAAHGNGSTTDVIQGAKGRIPGIADLDDLLDIDKLMVQSGIIEDDEVGRDTFVADYAPSPDALEKSATEAEEAQKREHILIQEQLRNDSNIGDFQAASGSQVSTVPPSDEDVTSLSEGQLIAIRQRLLSTPAGRLTAQKEKELEQDLLELSKKCIGLQNAVNAEKTMVEALSSRAGAMTKLKQAQEVNLLKQELGRTTNDLHAIVWKMNELHLANKQIDTKVVTRDQQLTYLEDYVSKLNDSTEHLAFEQQQYENQLAAENESLRLQLERLRMELWQLGESSPPMWRLSVPANGAFMDLGDDATEVGHSDDGASDDCIDDVIDMVEDEARRTPDLS